MTMPGIPVLYYGDEVGLAGASDPDSRRVMPDVPAAALPPAQASLLDGVRRHRARASLLARRCAARAPSIARRRRSHSPLHDRRRTIMRVVVLSRDTIAATCRRARHARRRAIATSLSAAHYHLRRSRTPSFTAQPLAAAIYLPEESACLR